MTFGNKVFKAIAVFINKLKYSFVTPGLEQHQTPREKCPYLELFWSVFSRIRTKYGEMAYDFETVSFLEHPMKNSKMEV